MLHISPSLGVLLDSHDARLVICRRTVSDCKYCKRWGATISANLRSGGSMDVHEQADTLAEALSLAESTFADLVNSSAFDRNGA